MWLTSWYGTYPNIYKVLNLYISNWCKISSIKSIDEISDDDIYNSNLLKSILEWEKKPSKDAIVASEGFLGMSYLK